ncbi:hemin uptake protein HemP [Mariluticola halotolerans]|uniref:hemin uptake protein HemP n=1 Tax=Mariluticola halotolerans TaxID=2909283 RepID=UPI0034A0B517
MPLALPWLMFALVFFPSIVGGFEMSIARRIDPLTPKSAANLSARKSEISLPPVVSSDALFAGGNEILIAHAGSHYRLTITRQGKLILTK